MKAKTKKTKIKSPSFDTLKPNQLSKIIGGNNTDPNNTGGQGSQGGGGHHE